MDDLIKSGSPMEPISTGYVRIGNAHAPVVVAVNQDGTPLGQQVDREILVSRYTVKTAFTGAAVGDVVAKVSVIAIGDTITLQGVTWQNETTGLAIGTPPFANLDLLKSPSPLTSADLTSAGLATSANQLSQLDYLTTLSDGQDRIHVLTALCDHSNWVESAVSTTYSGYWLAQAPGLDYNQGSLLTKSRTLDHATKTWSTAWFLDGVTLQTPNLATLISVGPEVITEHIRSRTSTLSDTPQSRTVRFLLDSPTTVHVDTGWA